MSMRQHLSFTCAHEICAATLDKTNDESSLLSTGLLIVSGGNEIRSGAHSGQSHIAQHFTQHGYPVFRYDRRGIGDSNGVNTGFTGSADDIAAAVACFRGAVPDMRRIIAFGNCDAASALALFHEGLAIDALILANPWVIEQADDATASSDQDESSGSAASSNAASIKARYLNRLKDPRAIIDLLTGKINVSKLLGGLTKLAQKKAPCGLASDIAAALQRSNLPCHILVAERDNTAIVFLSEWNSQSFKDVRKRDGIIMARLDSGSHSFASEADRRWLLEQIGGVLRLT